jgi:hypothetical protein
MIYRLVRHVNNLRMLQKKIQNEVTVLRKNNKYYLNETSEHATGKLCAWKKSN